MRKAGAFILLAALCAGAHAGDVANFVELGFSPGGETFAFGQYGTEDKTFSAYADIFFVDVAKNEFVPGANLSSPAGSTSGISSFGVFKQLKKKAGRSMSRLAIETEEGKPARAGRAIYAEDPSAPRNSGLAMSFRDFETGKAYDIALHQRTSGEGPGVSSSFYIAAKIAEPGGKEKSFTVGHPSFERKGVLGYRISRILTDASNSALVFVVEKEMYTPDGTSVRYMVETLSVDSSRL